MSTDLPPPPPPAGGDNTTPQAPKLKLNKPAGIVPPPPPAPTAEALIPPAPSVAAPAPTVRPTIAANANRNVSNVEVAFDLVALVVSLVGVTLLALELFVKTKG